MYSAEALPEPIQAYLAAYEQETLRPVRVLTGGFSSTFQNPGWIQRHVEETDFSVADGEERGITIVSWGGVTEGGQRQWHEMPSTLYQDAVRRDIGMRDILRPGEGASARFAETYEVSDDMDVMPIAEYSDRVVYYFTHLGQCFPNPELLDLDVLLKQPITLSIERGGEIRDRQREAARGAWIEFNGEARERRLEERRQQVSQHEAETRNNLQAYTDSLVRGRQLRAEIDALSQTIGHPAEHYGAEWDRITEHSRVTDRDFNSGILTVVTDPITMTNPHDSGQTALLGRFRLEFNTQTTSVHIHNMDGQRRGRDHPHVEGGQACWGDVGTQIARYLADDQFVAALEITLQYLESYNPDDDWGRYAQWWFDAPVELEV